MVAFERECDAGGDPAPNPGPLGMRHFGLVWVGKTGSAVLASVRFTWVNAQVCVATSECTGRDSAHRCVSSAWFWLTRAPRMMSMVIRVR